MQIYNSLSQCQPQIPLASSLSPPVAENRLGMLKFIAWRISQFPLMLAVVYLIAFLLAWTFKGARILRPVYDTLPGNIVMH